MTVLPPVPPVTGLRARVRLARDYYVRVDTVDYSVDPRVIGRLVDVTATLTRVVVTCVGQVVADHERCWARQVTVTDPEHVTLAKSLRSAYTADRVARARGRSHADGHRVQMRALPDYDVLFGIDTSIDWSTGEVSGR